MLFQQIALFCIFNISPFEYQTQYVYLLLPLDPVLYLFDTLVKTDSAMYVT